MLNLIQYMHDKYYYEEAEMALIDTDVRRTFATGIAGFSHVIDSLSAIKYAKVKAIRDDSGLAVDFAIEGDFPKYGNDDDRADDIGVWLLRTFLEMIKKRHTYRNSEATTSILTITSNVVYGKYTGALPDGRKAYTPFAPGANPSYGAEQNGLLASLNSVAKLPYHWALDGISNTQTINPDALGHSEGERVENLVQVMDGYFDQGAHHLNVNVFGKEKLIDAMEHPEKEEYANFTLDRVFRLRGQVHRPDPRAAAGRHQPHLPWPPVIPARRADPLAWRASARSMGRGSGSWCSCRMQPALPLLPQPRDLGLRLRLRPALDGGQAVRPRLALPQLLGAISECITVSGGEPLLQLPFLTEFFRLAHQKKVHTALDTAGEPFRPDDPAYLAAFDQLMQYTSLVILDLKEIDPEKHRRLTGRSNENILAMARHVAELGVPLWIRHVLVPGLTDDEDGLRRTGAFIASLPTVQRVEVLPYHTLGLFKWQKLGIPYSLADAVPPTDEQVRRAEELLMVDRYPRMIFNAKAQSLCKTGSGLF